MCISYLTDVHDDTDTSIEEGVKKILITISHYIKNFDD